MNELWSSVGLNVLWSAIALGSLRSNVALYILRSHVALNDLRSSIALDSLRSAITLYGLRSAVALYRLWSSKALNNLRSSVALDGLSSTIALHLLRCCVYYWLLVDDWLLLNELCCFRSECAAASAKEANWSSLLLLLPAIVHVTQVHALQQAMIMYIWSLTSFSSLMILLWRWTVIVGLRCISRCSNGINFSGIISLNTELVNFIDESIDRGRNC